MPTRDGLDAVTARLRARGWAFGDTARSIEVADPWITPVTVALPASTTDGLLTC